MNALELTPHKARYMAANSVYRAIKDGLLPRLDGSIACVDCAANAQEYDHRDYTKPLDVVPVCRSCNRKRGTGYPLTFARIVTELIEHGYTKESLAQKCGCRKGYLTYLLNNSEREPNPDIGARLMLLRERSTQRKSA